MALKSKENLAKTIGQNIRAIRRKKGISLKHFESLENSIDRHALSRIEKGEGAPNIYTLYRIAKVLGIEMKKFFANVK